MKNQTYLTPEIEILDVQVEGQIFQTSTNSDGVGLEEWGYEEF